MCPAINNLAGGMFQDIRMKLAEDRSAYRAPDYIRFRPMTLTTNAVDFLGRTDNTLGAGDQHKLAAPHPHRVVLTVPLFPLMRNGSIGSDLGESIALFLSMAGSKDFIGGLCRIHPPETIGSSVAISPSLMAPLRAESVCFHPPHDDRHCGVSPEPPPDAC